MSLLEHIIDVHPIKQVKVVMYNRSMATIVVFDVEVMIVSLLSDPDLVKEGTLAGVVNMFTGKEPEPSSVYGRIHTIKAWIIGVNRQIFYASWYGAVW
jgi:hypothetical protein